MPKKIAKRVELDVFVTEWTKAKDISSLCAKLGMKPNSAMVKAYLLRKRGVKLKKFTEPVEKVERKVWSVNALNKLIKSAQEAPVKHRGRPKGSKNRPKVETVRAGRSGETLAAQAIAAAPASAEVSH